MPVDAATPLLAWYGVHGRTLPWRARPGDAPPDPYAVWLSEIMLQQTTVAAVAPYFQAFLVRWPTVEALAGAEDSAVMAAWAGLGYYARARNLLACARAVVRDHGGRFPAEEAMLRTLPGIGNYTAAAIAAIGYGRRAVVVDGNVERVVSRLFAVDQALPPARPTLRRLAETITPEERSGDFAQAMMDLGSMICTPRNPACPICPLLGQCSAGRASTAETYPRKLPKRVKPHRRGTAFWMEAEGDVLLVVRPRDGLLGGMRALPTGPWSDADPGLSEAPVTAQWRIAGHVRHVFTHFSLDLALACAVLPKDAVAHLGGSWWPITDLAHAGLPTLFARVAQLRIGGRAPMADACLDLLPGA